MAHLFNKKQGCTREEQILQKHHRGPSKGRKRQHRNMGSAVMRVCISVSSWKTLEIVCDVFIYFFNLSWIYLFRFSVLRSLGSLRPLTSERVCSPHRATDVEVLRAATTSLPCPLPALCALTSSTRVRLLLSFTHLLFQTNELFSSCFCPRDSSHSTAISLFTVLSNNHPISAPLPLTHLRSALLSSALWPIVSVVTAVINQLIWSHVEPWNPEFSPLINQEVSYSPKAH